MDSATGSEPRPRVSNRKIGKVTGNEKPLGENKHASLELDKETGASRTMDQNLEKMDFKKSNCDKTAIPGSNPTQEEIL